MAIYESEHTKFMREWMKAHPEELEVQRQGRALWWDKPQDLKETAANTASSVKNKAYYYQNEV